jgi:hypothetical protein
MNAKALKSCFTHFQRSLDELMGLAQSGAIAVNDFSRDNDVRVTITKFAGPSHIV